MAVRDGRGRILDYIQYTIQHDDFELDEPQRVPVDQVLERIRNHPWKQEETDFLARQPSSEPSPAGVILALEDDQVHVYLYRPCAHLLDGEGDCYMIRVDCNVQKKLFGLIPYRTWRNAQYAFPDLLAALKLVDKCIPMLDAPNSLLAYLNGMDFLDFRL